MKLMSWLKCAVVVVVAASMSMGCTTRVFQDADRLVQVSTIDALLIGQYDGRMTVSELLRYGDFGLGTFDRLDGEMIVVDGRVYRIGSDGMATRMPGSATTPFAAVTRFQADLVLPVDEAMTDVQFQAWLGAQMPNPNLFYAIRVDGVFAAMTTRSVPAQEPPYQPLTAVTANQPVFTWNDVPGTLIGFWTPGLAKGLNVPGFHLHFISQRRQLGGHVLAFVLQNGVAKVDVTPRFEVILPQDEAFAKADFSKDLTTELHRAEK